VLSESPRRKNAWEQDQSQSCAVWQLFSAIRIALSDLGQGYSNWQLDRRYRWTSPNERVNFTWCFCSTGSDVFYLRLLCFLRTCTSKSSLSWKLLLVNSKVELIMWQ
jgi:hypothetical protein